MPRYLSTIDFKQRYFGASKHPSLSKIRRMCETGELPARRIGKTWFIDVLKFEAQGNPLVEKIISHVPCPA